MKSAAFASALAAVTALGACGGGGSDALDGVDSIIFLQRQQANAGMGDIFQNTAYRGKASIIMLTPPTADGTPEVLCCDHIAELADYDISGFDVSNDGSEIVFSARNSDTSSGLFVLDMTTREVEQLSTNPSEHYIYPEWLPGDKIYFSTTDVVEEGAPQFKDEYERSETTQSGTITRAGELSLFARNLSHRVYGETMFDGRILITQWDHLNGMNAGHLVAMNQDGSNVQEFVGKEGSKFDNSLYKATEVKPGTYFAIASSRSMTNQAGAIARIRAGQLDPSTGYYTLNMSEANATVENLTPLVPGGEEPSTNSVGRYHSVGAINEDENRMLVSWADGVVQSEVLGSAGLTSNFGIYLYDATKGERRPIFDNLDMDELLPVVYKATTAPPVVSGTLNSFDDQAVLIGSAKIGMSSIFNFETGARRPTVVAVFEGFSSEMGFPMDFGSRMTEGAALLGLVAVQEDESWAALIPPNIPVHLQVMDNYGMTLANETVWQSAGPGQSQMCMGCHEDRAATTVVQPGQLNAIAIGPADLLSNVPRFDGNGDAARVSSGAALVQQGSYREAVGFPWGGQEFGGLDMGMQAIFERDRAGGACVTCHEGTPSAANPSYQICDEDMVCQTVTFDLRGQTVELALGEMYQGWPASYLTWAGPDMEAVQEGNMTITGDMKVYGEDEDPAASYAALVFNPYSLFNGYADGNPSQPKWDPNPSDRLFDSSELPAMSVDHTIMLSPLEQYFMFMNMSAGLQAYSLENAPNAVDPY